MTCIKSKAVSDIVSVSYALPNIPGIIQLSLWPT